MKMCPETKIGLLTKAILLIALLAGNFAAASDDDDDAPPAAAGKPNPCKNTAQLVLQAARAEATSEYWLALARASTLPDAAERKAAQVQARKDLTEGKVLAREQYQARLKVCEILGERDRYHPVINPDDFLTPAQIAANPNRYFPLVPGTTYRYRAETEEGTELNDVTVTHDTKEILGVTTVVVRDIVWLNGELTEDTLDWYAQDRAGNVWYFGELTLNFEGGQLADIEGSWEAGVEGGKAGIIMKANPQVGDAYRQEFAPGVVEDAAQVVALNQSVTVPYGSFNGCVETAEFTPIEPDSVDDPEHKFYAPDIGFVLEVKPSGERLELIAIERQ